MKFFLKNLRRFKGIYFFAIIPLILVIVFFLTVAVTSRIIKKDILPFGICKGCNVILISLDTLRSKSLPCYGYNKDTAPNLCEFANNSFLFTNSYSQSAYTLDSQLSIFTSVYPSVHRVITPFVSVLDSKIMIIPEILKRFGFINLYVGSVDHTLPLDKGLGRDFNFIKPSRSIENWIQLFDDFIPKHNFFAFFHSYDVHEPYIPKRENLPIFYKGPVKIFITQQELCLKVLDSITKKYPDRLRKMKIFKNLSSCELLQEYDQLYLDDATPDLMDERYGMTPEGEDKLYWDTFNDINNDQKKEYMQALYETKIYELDLKLKEFFDYLKQRDLMKNTIVVITSVHGEEFFEHNKWSHANSLYNEVLRVPLIIYVPNAKPLVIDKLAQGVDIFPTLLYLLGIEDDSIKEQLTGINLFSKEENEYVVSQHFGDRKYALTGKEWKLIVNNDNPDAKITKELYQLTFDPGEQENLALTNTRKVAAMEKTLKNILDKQPLYEQKTQPFPSWIDEEQRKKLIETGYF